MALTQRLADATVNLEADTVCAVMNGGRIRIYDGVQPVTADMEITTQHLLVELTLPNPAFGAAQAGVAVAKSISPGTIVYPGTATWYRILTSDNINHHDGSVGTSGCNCILDSVAFQVNAKCTITSFRFRASKH